jgi:hypothetical protein
MGRREQTHTELDGEDVARHGQSDGHVQVDACHKWGWLYAVTLAGGYLGPTVNGMVTSSAPSIVFCSSSIMY